MIITFPRIQNIELISLEKYFLFRRVNNELSDTVNCNDVSSIEPLLQGSGDPVSISETDLFNAEMEQSNLKGGDLKFEVLINHIAIHGALKIYNTLSLYLEKNLTGH